IGFDLTQKNVWLALTGGGVVCLPGEDFDPDSILSLIATGRVALTNMAPSAFRALVDADRGSTLTALRAVYLGGEPIHPEVVRPLLDAGVRLVNSYGPTEASDVVSAHTLSVEHAGFDDGIIPVGTPVWNTTLRV